VSGHRFLIVRLGSLGDVVHGIPAAAALRAHFPDARIDWMVDPRYVELLELVEGLDARIPVDTRRPARVLSTMRDLRSVGYDAVIDLQGLIKSAVLARAVGATRTIGFPTAHLRERPASVFYTTTPDPGSATHVIKKNLALLAPLGVREPAVAFPIAIPHTPAVEEVASRAGAKGYVLLNPGAAWPNKRWPPERFAQFAAELRDRRGLTSIVLWGPGEELIATSIVAASRGAAAAAPPTTISDLFAIARGAKLMISGDTGPLHIASAIGTPVVALFGPTFPERNGPWRPADVVISRADRCTCHYQRECRRSLPCIREITVHDAVTAAEQRLG
jgi:lipopolysaccharide heptosyltransferase I